MQEDTCRLHQSFPNPIIIKNSCFTGVTPIKQENLQERERLFADLGEALRGDFLSIHRVEPPKEKSRKVVVPQSELGHVLSFELEL